VPSERVLGNTQYRPEMHGMDVPGAIYAHIAGVDLVRADEGAYYVLEDNLRVPSGVSYMLENRRMMMRLFPELFANQSIKPVEHYPDLLLENLRGVAPAGEERQSPKRLSNDVGLFDGGNGSMATGDERKSVWRPNMPGKSSLARPRIFTRSDASADRPGRLAFPYNHEQSELR